MRLYVRLGIAIVAGAIFLAIRLANPSRVTFSPANVSIDPGKGWKKLEVPAAPPTCTPRLVSKLGMINATVLDDETTELKAAADKLRAAFVAAGKALPEEVQQEDFTTAGGLGGIHLSYTAKSDASTTAPVRSHSFITHNMRGRCVSISYITSSGSESAAVTEAITKTLRVE